VVVITAGFTGMVLALQSFTAFKRFGAETMVGTVVALSMTRELGPVLTGLMVSGRMGSAMAAELGRCGSPSRSMPSTPLPQPDQIPHRSAIFSNRHHAPHFGHFRGCHRNSGGYLVGVQILGTNPTLYFRRTWDFLEVNDLYSGLIKAIFFGMILSTICCYQGFSAQGEQREWAGRRQGQWCYHR